MTGEQMRHLQAIQASFLIEVAAKYQAGAKQHGGNVWSKPGLLEMAMDECVDLYVYLYTLKQQRDHPEIVDLNARDIDVKT